MANRYLVATGNWSSTSVWSATSGGAGGASVPTSSDTVEISDGFTVTMDVNGAAGAVNHSQGTINLSSYTLDCGNFYQVYGSGTKVLNMQSGTMIVSLLGMGSTFDLTSTSPTNYTLNAGSSTLVINSDSFSNSLDFYAGSFTFNDAILNLGTSGSIATGGVNVYGSPTFRSLIVQSKNSAAHTVNLGGDITVNKFIAYGTSTNRLTLTGGDNSGGPFSITTSGSYYGQYLNVDYIYIGGDAPKYLGSNSVKTDYPFNSQVLLQDPPKISTLVDPLTTAPASNTNWTVTGTVTKVTSGHDGGGYAIGNYSSMISTDTFDIIGSSFIFEVPDEGITSTDDGGLAIGIGEVYGYSDTTIAFDNLMSYGEIFTNGAYPEQNGLFNYPVSGSVFIKTTVSDTGLVTVYKANETVAFTYQLTDVEVLKMRSTRVTIGAASSVYVGSINPNLNSPPTTTLTTPTNATTLTTDKPALTFKATDPDGDAVSYHIVIYNSSDDNFFYESSESLLDPSWPGTGTYASGADVTYTLQTGLTKGGITYYWKARAKDPSGSDSWGEWSSVNTFTLKLSSNFLPFF